MATVADMIAAHLVGGGKSFRGAIQEAGSTVRGAVQLAAGMSLIAAAFVVAQLLLFLEELWWTP